MTKTPISLSTEDTVDVAYEVLETHNFHHIPIVDTEHRLQGILSKQDLINLAHGRTLFAIGDREELNYTFFRTLRCKDVMTCNVSSLRSDQTIKDAMALFSNNLFHAIPIVDAGHLVGIVSTYDLLNFAYAEDNA